MMKQFLLSFLLLLPFMASAEPIEIDGIYYNLIKKGNFAEVTSNPEKYSGIIEIPKEVIYMNDRYDVTAIGESAFEGCNIESVTIPNSVTTIGRAAFWASSLTEIIIPNSVTSIGRQAFEICTSLSSVIIPNSVIVIGNSAFNATSIKSVTIPESVTTIEAYAFSNCNKLEAVYITDLEAWCNISFGSESANPLHFAHHLFLNDLELTTLDIPNSVTFIGRFSFIECQGLLSVNIPSSITYIGSSAFYGCTGLTSIDIPNSVTSIHDEAFKDCSELSSVSIGKGIKKISNEAFANCQQLNDVYCYAEEVPVSEENTFDNAYIDYATLHVPEKSVNSYKSTEPWNGFKEVVPLETTRIDAITHNPEENKIKYNLNGQRVDNTQKGIYIHNNKKIIIK